MGFCSGENGECVWDSVVWRSGCSVVGCVCSNVVGRKGMCICSRQLFNFNLTISDMGPKKNVERSSSAHTG